MTSSALEIVLYPSHQHIVNSMEKVQARSSYSSTSKPQIDIVMDSHVDKDSIIILDENGREAKIIQTVEWLNSPNISFAV